MSHHKRKRGRPRKPGERYKSGHLKKVRRPALESPRTIAASMPHRRGLGDAAVDARAESELGRMALRGELTDVQLTAGETYAALWHGYVATLQGPRATWDGSGGGTACVECPSPADPQFCVCWFRRKIWDEAFHALVSTGRGALLAVHGVVINDRPCLFEGLEMLRIGLSALAQHFGLTRRKNSVTKNIIPNASVEP